jgi:hypothetical protein
MQSLQLHLTGAARSWLSTLPDDSIESWGELENQFKKFPVNIQTTIVNRRSQILYAEKGRNVVFIYTTVEYNNKNSAEDVFDERAVDAFASGLHRSDLVEELGRTKPETMSELMEIANRFADGEDTYHRKRARSPEYDKSSRQHNQRRRSRTEDGHTMGNQIAAGYERRDGEGDENEEYHKKDNHRRDWPKYFDLSAEDILHGPCRIHYAYLDGKRVSNHLMRD